MNRPPNLFATANLSGCSLKSAQATVALSGLTNGTCLGVSVEALLGRTVLLWTTDHLHCALALIELDGIVRRMVLCPPGIPLEGLAYIAETAGADTIISDLPSPERAIPGVERWIECSSTLTSALPGGDRPRATEWVLLTSGTTGVPKLVVHTLASLAGAIKSRLAPSASPVVWSTFYDIRRYGGLQIFLRALLTGSSLVLTSPHEAINDFLIRAGKARVTHISGTPSHWRSALRSPSAHSMAPRYVRLSGEIADQSILNHLRSCYPEATIVHAFASTEAGVAFEVTDGLSGFPSSLVGSIPDVDVKIEDGSLNLRSSRVADCYLNGQAKPIKSADGFVDTGDLVELRGDRYHFIGRRDGVINIGGLKVHPEEVEAVINRHPEVFMSLVRTKRNPITGAIVVADVVLKSSPADPQRLQRDLIGFCRDSLAGHKVPAVIKFVPELAISETGKLVRHEA